VTSFAGRCGIHDAARVAACDQVLRTLREQQIDRVRIGWCDTHGVLRGKTLMAAAVPDALAEGIGLVGTLLLKDTSDRTAFKVFEAGMAATLPGFEFAANLQLLPDPASFQILPWTHGTAWMQGQPWFPDARPVPLDTRRVLQAALARLADAGHGLRCGLEIEFHVYRIVQDRLDPAHAAWPGDPPELQLIHPGYNLLAESNADMADEALRIVQHTAQGLGLPLRSLEIELGPSQVEAVFDVSDALAAADAMVLFRNGVKQALRRAGYFASFVCRPPFDHVMASGWHLHQSLVDRATGRNAFVRDQPAAGSMPRDANHVLSDAGEHWLAGLLAHARGAAVMGTPTINGFGRFRPNALAPQAVLWGRDNRGAMLRVIGGAGDAATRIENRVGEPMANPYLYIASQIHAGLDGLARQRRAPQATEAPYAAAAEMLPTSLGEALAALHADDALVAAFGPAWVDWYSQIKHAEMARHNVAEDKADWERREYFSRY
jgi:glutamine synthetase